MPTASNRRSTSGLCHRTWRPACLVNLSRCPGGRVADKGGQGGTSMDKARQGGQARVREVF